MKATKTNFRRVYRRELMARYPWANEHARRAKFMLSVRATLNGANTWCRDGDAYYAALKAVGLPKRVSLKTLQSMTT
jgi:hypothetical protein